MTAREDVRATITDANNNWGERRYRVCLVVGHRVMSNNLTVTLWGARRLARHLVADWKSGRFRSYHHEVIR